MSTTEQPVKMKIVIVAGQEFSVPESIDNEAIRQQLAPQFPDVATAEIKKGKRMVGQVEHVVIEFVKKAGTKGMDGAALGGVLHAVPRSTAQLPLARSHLIQRLEAEDLTFGEAIARADELGQALMALVNQHGAGGQIEDDEDEDDGIRIVHTDEAQLCSVLDSLPAVAATGAFAW